MTDVEKIIRHDEVVAYIRKHTEQTSDGQYELGWEDACLTILAKLTLED